MSAKTARYLSLILQLGGTLVAITMFWASTGEKVDAHAIAIEKLETARDTTASDISVMKQDIATIKEAVCWIKRAVNGSDCK